MDYSKTNPAPLNGGADPTQRDAILFISHDASRTGAPIALLNIIRWLRPRVPNRFRIILRMGGPLEPQFRSLGEVHTLPNEELSPHFFEDVCLIYSNTATNGLFLKSLPLGDIPVLTHVHELDRTIDWLGEENFREVEAQTTHFIACSQAVARMLKRAHGIAAARVSVVPESISVSEVQAEAQAESPRNIRRSLGIGADDFVVAGCGTADLRKGADLFVQIAAHCSRRAERKGKVRFLWIGIVPKEFATGFFEIDAVKLGMSRHIRFLGEMERPYPFLMAADLLCLPSREDPFPLVMLEAGALGKPLLAFKGSGGAEEFCRRGGGFLIPYLDVPAMAEWILSHQDDRPALVAAGERARNLVQNSYDLDVTGPSFAGLIRHFSRPRLAAPAGTSQLFAPALQGHSDANSSRQRVLPDRWNRLKFTFRSRGEGESWTVRFDPLDQVSLIEIAALRLKAAGSRRVLWKARTPGEFDALAVAGTAVRLPDQRVLRLLSLGHDPIVYLPTLEVGPEEQDYLFEAILRVHTSIDSVVRCCQPLLDAYREQGTLRRQLTVQEGMIADRDALRSQLTASQRLTQDLRFALFCAEALPDGRRLLIWGTGAGGRRMASALRRHKRDFSGFVDRNPEKAGKKLLGRPIYPASVLSAKNSPRPFIIIGSMFHRQIGKRLGRMGYARGADYASFLWHEQ